MYSLDCSYFDKTFETLDALVDYLMQGSMDPSYEITRDGVGIGEYGTDFIQF